MSLEIQVFTSMWTSPVLMILAIPLLLFFIRKHNKQRPYEAPPSPVKLPIIGNLHQLGALPHQTLAKLAKKHGPVMLLHLAYEPLLVISSAEAAKEALKTRETDFSGRPPLVCAAKVTYNNLDIAFAQYGEYRRQMSKICTLELFSAKRVQSFQPVRAEELNAMIESMAISASKDEAVDFGRKLFTLTAGILFRVAFGMSFKGSVMDGEEFEKLISEFEAVIGSFAFADYFPYVGWIVDRISGLHSRLNWVFMRLDAFFQHLIDEHKNQNKAKDEYEDIVDVLLRIQREHETLGATWFTENHIKGALVNIFVAGVDTSALTLVWAMAELLKNPSVMKKAQDELRHSTAAGTETISEKDLDNLKYLKMVLKESMRLHPVAPLLLPKQTTTDTRVGGYQIRKGTRVYINAWAIGRDPATWNQPEKLFPERFQDSLVDYKGQHFEMLPFGGGRRICPAMNMAMATVELALANLLYCFDWKLPEGTTVENLSMEEGAGLTAFKNVPLELVTVKYHKPECC